MPTSDRHDLLRRRSFGICRQAKWSMTSEAKSTRVSPSSARRETTLQREIAVKNLSLGIFDPSLGIFDPARCRRNPDFWGGFPPKSRSVLRNRQGIPRLSGVSSRAHEAGMRENGAGAKGPLGGLHSCAGLWLTTQ